MLNLLAAVLVSAVVILSAPFMGQIRAWLRATFPGQFVVIVGGSVAVAIVIGVVVALVRIRERPPSPRGGYGATRLFRYGAIAAALLLGIAYNAAMATGRPEIDAVERVHFVEYGLIALLFYRVWRPRGDPSIFILPVLAGVIVGTIEEWFQWFIPVRVGEVRDVALNLVAIACGLLFSTGAAPPATFTRMLRPASRMSLGVFASAALLVLAAFVHAVHLGHVVSHEDIGSFKSRYRAEDLRSLAGDRAARWRQDPPLTFRRLSREDQYMDEGLWHVRRRNEAWAEGDQASAWKENRILEEYFAPVLDTPSYVSAAGHRWHPDHRAAAQRSAAGGDTFYISTAEPLPIVTWPKPAFWSVVALFAGLSTAIGWLRDRRRGRG